MTEPAILIDKLSKTYSRGWRKPPVPAVQDVSLRIESGETVGFIGHNGAGKSSTIRTVLGLQRASSGHVYLRGVPVSNPASRFRVGYVPENPLLYDVLTPLEILRFAARSHGIGKTNLASRCDEWLARFGLAAHGSMRLRELSKGLTQRTALAAALVIDPEILVLDEPLSGLDPVGRSEVIEILSEFRRSGRTMLFSSHILSDVERMADRFVFMHSGKVVCEDGLGEFDQHKTLFEVRVRYAGGIDGFEKAGFHQLRIVVPEPDLESLLVRIRAEGASLISAKSVYSLERAYADYVRKAEKTN